MQVEKIRLGDKEVMPFTIPSGIVVTSVKALENIARDVPEVGILTTKSIGPHIRSGNREPILSEYAPGCFVNAVGLTNPGCEQFARELAGISFPSDKFLLASIFGGNANEFVEVAKRLEDQVDGFELNLSCPHVAGHGMQLGQDPKLVFEIVYRVNQNTNRMVFAKLSPNVTNIGEIAKAAMAAGANGIVAINTVGPGLQIHDGYTVLSNQVGGMSGLGVLPIGVRSVREIRQAIGKNVPIIGMGGIRNANEVISYSFAGANAFGIGSALIGMNDARIRNYFNSLVLDLEDGENSAEDFLIRPDMNYKKVRVKEIENNGCDFKIYRTDTSIEAHAGQFVFAWIPGVGEKPFSVMDDDPLTLGVLTRGQFTREFNNLQVGDIFYYRGPHGNGVSVPKGAEVVLVGGGCGIAGIYLLAKQLSRDSTVTSIIGAKDKEHLVYYEEFKKLGRVLAATEDGSVSMKGTVYNRLCHNSNHGDIHDGSYFFNCGPKAMVEAVLPIETFLSSPERVFSSVDYMTKCGVGICGSCTDLNGLRTCVEGPFI